MTWINIIEGVEVDSFQAFIDNKGIIYVWRCVTFAHAPDFTCNGELENCVRSFVGLGPVKAHWT